MEFENVSSQLRHSLTLPPEENVYSQRRKQCTIFNSRLEKFGRFKISGACAGKRPREKPGIPSVFDFPEVCMRLACRWPEVGEIEQRVNAKAA